MDFIGMDKRGQLVYFDVDQPYQNGTDSIMDDVSRLVRRSVIAFQQVEGR
jgi:hypothetical protein